MSTNIAVQYVEAGLALVPIPKGRKGPTSVGWQTQKAAITTVGGTEKLPKDGNLGLAHLWSHTCALDVDDYSRAAEWLSVRGVNLTELLAAVTAVRITSGREGRAKLIYRLPDVIAYLPTQQPADSGLELRCASSDGKTTLQDVLPPSVHPDTGKPYEWIGNWKAIPPIPEALLALWQGLATKENPDRPRLGLENDIVLKALADRGLLREAIPGRVGDGWKMYCPWSTEHTSPAVAGDAMYFEANTQGYKGRGFKCMHSHCSGRGIKDLLGFLKIKLHKYVSISQSAAEIVDEKTAWTWVAHIPKEDLTIVAGNPNAGKSHFVASLAGILSSGRKFPMQETKSEPGTVYFIDRESHASQTWRPRLRAEEADLNKCLLFNSLVPANSTEEHSESVVVLNFENHIAVLEEELHLYSDLKMVIIDPITAYLGDVNANSQADVQNVLGQLSDLARRLRCPIIGVTHMNKAENLSASNRIIGSVSFRTVARTIIMVGSDPKDEERRIVAWDKLSAGKIPKSLAFRIETSLLPDGIETSRVRWEEKTNDFVPNELFGPRKPKSFIDEEDNYRGSRERAMDFILNFLREGEKPATEVLKAAAEGGFNEKTLNRARKQLGIKTNQRDRAWWWKLPQEIF